MPNNTIFHFKKYSVMQGNSAMKVSTDACVFGAWVAQMMTKCCLRPATILDIGTGTGVLSLLLAHTQVQSRITGIDINAAALSDATLNFSNSPFSKRLNTQLSSVFQLPELLHFDFYICNPPFHQASTPADNVAKNTAWHDIEMPIIEIAKLIHKVVLKGKYFAIMYPPRSADIVIAYLSKQHISPIATLSFSHNALKKPHCNMLLFGPNIASAIHQIIYYKSTAQTDSSDFVSLMQPYYQYL